MSNWNEDRVEMLKKFWAEGHSASQIAGRIGEVSRNAVISKVHRLGLSGRTTTNRKPMQSRKYAGPLVAAQTVTPRPAKTVQWRNPFIPGGPVGAEKKPVEPYREQPAPRVFDRSRFVRTVDLEEHHCRWPVGDPRDIDFRHCGEDRVPGLRVPYCIRCVRMAFSFNATGVNSRQDGQTAVTPARDTQEPQAPAGDAPDREMEDA